MQRPHVRYDMITVAWYFTDENVIHVLYIYSTYYFTDLPLCIEGMELSNLTTNFIVHTGTFLCACLDSYTYIAIFFNKWIAFSWFVNPSNSVFSNCLRLSADISMNLQSQSWIYKCLSTQYNSTVCKTSIGQSQVAFQN